MEGQLEAVSAGLISSVLLAEDSCWHRGSYVMDDLCSPQLSVLPET